MKTKIFIGLLFLSASISAQFSGKAIYKSSAKSNFAIESERKGLNDEMHKRIRERLRKANQKTYVLNFNKSESIYKEDVQLDNPNKSEIAGARIIGFGGGANNVLYKNIKENRMADKTSLMGKGFLIKDKLNKYDWKLTGETKNIGKYTCYKAEYKKENTTQRMSMVGGEMKQVEETVTTTVTAWYTSDIPVSNGPKDYWGLPGLILEVNDGRLTIVCTEIILNPSKKIAIKEPTKGKKVSRKEYQKIEREKSQEMMNRFRSRNGNNLQFKIGG